jgi:predicted kinase
MCARFYIMTGLPYSGKTTLSMALTQHLGCAVVSVDRIMDDRDMWRNGTPAQEEWNEADSEAYRELEELLAKGSTVVFDCAPL